MSFSYIADTGRNYIVGIGEIMVTKVDVRYVRQRKQTIQQLSPIKVNGYNKRNTIESYRHRKQKNSSSLGFREDLWGGNHSFVGICRVERS